MNDIGSHKGGIYVRFKDGVEFTSEGEFNFIPHELEKIEPEAGRFFFFATTDYYRA
jgi:hypothetical protein